MFITKKLLLLLLSAVLISAQNYCDPELCPGGTRHIACNNNGAFVRNCNGSMVSMQPHIAYILAQHNERRNEIAGGNLTGFPSAVRMATMSWDAELARLAAYNALECRMEHDECRNTRTHRSAGQNLAILYSRNVNITTFIRERIADWYEEHRNANQNDMERYRPRGGSPIGHFTVMVNERNIRLGCAIAQFTDAIGLEATLLVCNYAITNIVDNPVYRSGTVASECSTGRNTNYGNLCGSGERYS